MLNKIKQFYDLNTDPRFGQLLIVMGQCHSGGFLDETATLGGNVGFASAAYWGECSESITTAPGTIGNTFLNPWADAVDAPVANDGFLDAFNTAVLNDVAATGPSATPTSPQYYSSDAGMDALTLAGGTFVTRIWWALAIERSSVVG